MVPSFFFKNVTLLITHYNRSTSLERLLKTCRDLKYAFEEIIVSDDCSYDEHLEYVKNLQVEYNFVLLTTPVNRGLGHNLNKGQAAVKTEYTLYIQEDFIPHANFGKALSDAFSLMEENAYLDVIRFYSYIKYPHLKPFAKGFSEMIYKSWSPFYYKIYKYTDHPHLRRSNFAEKFGKYDEGRQSDRTEYHMCITFIQQKGNALFYTDYQGLLTQTNHDAEPSTLKRNKWMLSKNPFVKLVRDSYRQLRYNYDLRFLRPNFGYALSSDMAKITNSKAYLWNILKSIVIKMISFWVSIRHKNAEPAYKQFYKDTYYCNLVQVKYLFSDYIFKRKYKTITFDGEFAPELQFALPFAYWHHKNGTLKKTIASKFTKELYFFSEDHQESFEERSNGANYNFEIPRVLYSQNYDMIKWEQVPLKAHYQNDIYIFDKPILIIANRYNMEWNAPPVSFLSIPVLASIFEKLKNRFTIVYNRPRPQNIITDDSHIYDLNEFEWIKNEHPEIVLMEDLYDENKAGARNFNHLQLMVYANSEHFISTHGGTSALASYFGGINLILSKKGPEHHFKCYHKLYPKLSGARILHAKTDEELDMYINKHFVISSN